MKDLFNKLFNATILWAFIVCLTVLLGGSPLLGFTIAAGLQLAIQLITL